MTKLSCFNYPRWNDYEFDWYLGMCPFESIYSKIISWIMNLQDQLDIFNQALLEISQGSGSQTSQGRDANSPGGSGAVRETKGGICCCFTGQVLGFHYRWQRIIHIMVHTVYMVIWYGDRYTSYELIESHPFKDLQWVCLVGTARLRWIKVSGFEVSRFFLCW